MDFRTFVPNDERPGVAGAVEACIINLRALKATTAIVLPPRYGKSDAMRLLAIEAQALGLVSAVVIMVPWVALKDQIKDKKKIEAMVKRYFSAAAAPPVAIVDDVLEGGFSWRFNEDAKGRTFWVITIPQASQPASLEALCQAAVYYKNAGRPPLLVLIDEGQYVGGVQAGEQQWITVAKRLVQSGAYVDVFTGTPDRNDKTVPFGFEAKEVNRCDYTRKALRKDDDQLWLDIYEGQLVGYELIADYKVSLSEAWDQSKPPILAKLDARWVGFPSDNKQIEDISDPKEIRRALAIGLRRDEVIEAFAREGVDDVKIRRQTRPDSAMLVFVGNDQLDEAGGKDWHARSAKRIIQREWRRVFGHDGRILIATLDDKGDGKEAAKTIKKFIAGDGDVLIVKMMGSVGLDVERIKTLVDLSTVRATSNTTQRWLRACTIWGNLVRATIVLPCDAITKALWSLIVVANNGEFKRFEDGVLVDSKPIDPDEPDPPPEIGDPYRAGASDAATRQSIDAVTDLDVDRVLAKTPLLIERHSRVEIATLIRDGVINVPEDVEPARTVVRDLATEIRTAMDRINALSLEIAKAKTPYFGNKVNGEEFRTTIQGVYITIAERAGIRGQLKRCRDLDKLHAAELVAQEYLRETRTGNR